MGWRWRGEWGGAGGRCGDGCVLGGVGMEMDTGCEMYSKQVSWDSGQGMGRGGKLVGVGDVCVENL